MGRASLQFDENPRGYMRDDTVCLKCDGTEGPAIIAASVLVPIFLVGVPLAVMRLERTRAFACKTPQVAALPA